MLLKKIISMRKLHLIFLVLFFGSCGKDLDDQINQKSDFRIIGQWDVASIEGFYDKCQDKESMTFDAKTFSIRSFVGDSCQIQDVEKRGTYKIENGVLYLIDKDNIPFLEYNIEYISTKSMTLHDGVGLRITYNKTID